MLTDDTLREWRRLADGAPKGPAVPALLDECERLRRGLAAIAEKVDAEGASEADECDGCIVNFSNWLDNLLAGREWSDDGTTEGKVSK